MSIAQLTPGLPTRAGQLRRQTLEEPPHLPAVPFGDTAHDEDGGGGQAAVAGGEGGQLQRGHLGVLHFAELALQHGERAHVAEVRPP